MPSKKIVKSKKVILKKFAALDGSNSDSGCCASLLPKPSRMMSRAMLWSLPEVCMGRASPRQLWAPAVWVLVWVHTAQNVWVWVGLQAHDLSVGVGLILITVVVGCGLTEK